MHGALLVAHGTVNCGAGGQNALQIFHRHELLHQGSVLAPFCPAQHALDGAIAQARWEQLYARAWLLVCAMLGALCMMVRFTPLCMHHTCCSSLVGDVKAVGPAISCEGSPYKGDPSSEWRRNPHVQSYLVATDA
jgi:hypothetical protein